MRLIVVSGLHPQRPRQFTTIVAFSPISPALFRLIVVLFCILFDPTSPRPLPDWLLRLSVGWCGPLWPLSLTTEVKCPLEPSSAHLCPASAVMVTATAAESTPTTPPSIVEAFVMVLVGFGGVWGGWGRYLEAAGHGRGGGCVVRWAKNGEKRALSWKKSQVRTNGVQNHHGGIKSIGTLVKVRWPWNRAALWLSNAVFTLI